MSILKIAFAGLLAVAGSAQAVGVVPFFDDFNANTLAKDAVPIGWTVTGGSVDIVGSPPPFFDFLPGNGMYIDLDGSSSPTDPALLAKEFDLSGGVLYKAEFFLAGSQRGSEETVDVNFGTAIDSFILGAADPFGMRTISFTPGLNGTYSLSFLNKGSDNVGALLDNVNIYAVPEPGTYAMLFAGLGVIGFLARRRRARF